MTRLDRIIEILDRYDRLVSTYIDQSDLTISKIQLNRLREDKAILIEELISERYHWLSLWIT